MARRDSYHETHSLKRVFNTGVVVISQYSHNDTPTGASVAEKTGHSTLLSVPKRLCLLFDLLVSWFVCLTVGPTQSQALYNASILYLFIYLFIHSSIHSFIHLFIYFVRSFVAAPRLWNSLSLNCRTAPSVNTFQIRLNTFLFDLA